MIKVIIAYDDNDEELGDYFIESFNDIKVNLSNLNDISLISKKGLECTEENIKTTILESGFPFIFMGLSHGNEQQLLTENDVFVNGGNVEHFENSLFYSPACSSAVHLGVELIKIGCYSFVGCNKDTFASSDSYKSTYIECENYCIKDFLNSNNTVQESFNNMLNFFDQRIDMLFEKSYDDILVALELQHNKDSFVLYGNESLRKSDFLL